MSLLVLKFGGTSVADLERIRNVALHVKREADAGHACAVVVSAMAGQTNQLVALVEEAWGYKARSQNGGQASAMFDTREYDAVVSSGEQVTSGLLALVLQAMGVNARSWQGWQIPVRTDAAHRAARIVGIDVGELKERVLAGEVGVVAGFQGIAPGNRIATLGRGGSERRFPPTAAISTRTWTGSTQRTPAWCQRRTGWTASPMKRCSKWPRKGPRFCKPGPWSSPCKGACGCSCGRASMRPISPVLAIRRRARGLGHLFAMRMRSWSRTSSVELLMRGTKPR